MFVRPQHDLERVENKFSLNIIYFHEKFVGIMICFKYGKLLSSDYPRPWLKVYNPSNCRWNSSCVSSINSHSWPWKTNPNASSFSFGVDSRISFSKLCTNKKRKCKLQLYMPVVVLLASITYVYMVLHLNYAKFPHF